MKTNQTRRSRTLCFQPLEMRGRQKGSGPYLFGTRFAPEKQGNTAKIDGLALAGNSAHTATHGRQETYTGRKPTLRTYEMVCHYFTGLADEEELLAHIQKLKPQDA